MRILYGGGSIDGKAFSGTTYGSEYRFRPTVIQQGLHADDIWGEREDMD